MRATLSVAGVELSGCRAVELCKRCAFGAAGPALTRRARGERAMPRSRRLLGRAFRDTTRTHCTLHSPGTASTHAIILSSIV
ncbi:hypothetical protein RR48_14542 [Papilio machaon]|uniref:Uncharacterized protein n=1 Tax=Papilio machaon TaxID=76193 RepID=A0A194QMB8_PAPMA|nr:hypothetical protein RR48_14542 [Papilio machaon]